MVDKGGWMFRDHQTHGIGELLLHIKTIFFNQMSRNTRCVHLTYSVIDTVVRCIVILELSMIAIVTLGPGAPAVPDFPGSPREPCKQIT